MHTVPALISITDMRNHTLSGSLWRRGIIPYMQQKDVFVSGRRS